MGQTSTVVECTIPILCVRSVAASVRYYVDVLGFRVDWGEGGTMASVSRDGQGIMLCEGGQGGPGTWVWVGVEDVGPLLEEWRGRGAKVIQVPTNYPWAYEMRVEDLDGHVLRVGSEVRGDMPVVRE